jgi:serine phosphatase RsbU (regulator of sigma subunit)
MATTRAVIRAAAQAGPSAPDIPRPGIVLERVNDLLFPDMPPKMFVTCFYCILDPATGRLVCANAGQDLPFHRRREGSSKVVVTGLPLGLMPGMSYEELELALLPGESMLFYSDGLIEAHNARFGPACEMAGHAGAKCSLD